MNPDDRGAPFDKLRVTSGRVTSGRVTLGGVT
jgi:hypothetical protein